MWPNVSSINNKYLEYRNAHYPVAFLVHHQKCRRVNRQFILLEYGVTSVYKRDKLCCIFHVQVQSFQSRTNYRKIKMRCWLGSYPMTVGINKKDENLKISEIL